MRDPRYKGVIRGVRFASLFVGAMAPPMVQQGRAPRRSRWPAQSRGNDAAGVSGRSSIWDSELRVYGSGFRF